jgi:hypothetical protein
MGALLALVPDSVWCSCVFNNSFYSSTAGLTAFFTSSPSPSATAGSIMEGCKSAVRKRDAPHARPGDTNKLF